MSSPPGWYPDPANAAPGSLRYFDGAAWTSDVASPSVPLRPITWKGVRFGRPPIGPGSLANPWLRLVAQVLDGLILLPFAIGLYLVMVFVIFERVLSLSGPNGNSGGNPGSIVAIFLWFLLMFALYFAAIICYQGITTAVWGRSPGKAIVSIRPICLDGAALSWGRSFGRAATYAAASLFSPLSTIDVLWCLWDDDTQCLHDKVCGTLVITDTG